MTHITRRVAQSALLIAAAGMAPLLGTSTAHADSPLGGIGGMNGLSTPDATTVTDQVPGATDTLTGTAHTAGKAAQTGVPGTAKTAAKTAGTAVPAAGQTATQGTEAAAAQAPAQAPTAVQAPVSAPGTKPAAQVNAPVAAPVPAAPTGGLPGLGGGLPKL